MTDNKKYIINVGDQAEEWTSDMYAQKGDSLFAKYKDAEVFEVEDAADFDEDPTDHQYIINVGDESEVWDGDMVKEKGARLKEAYPDVKIQRVSYKDYWGEQATANREQRALLAQPDQERNAKLADLGYYDDITGEAFSYTQSEEGVPQWGPSLGLQPLSSIVGENEDGTTSYADPKVAEFFASDTSYTDRQAEIARLDAEYESNPSVIAQREYEAQWRADQAKYNDTLEAQIRKDAEADGVGDAQRRQNRKMAPMLGMGNPMLVAQYNAMYADAELPTKQSENYASALNMMEKIKELQKVSEKGFSGATLDVAKEKFESWREPDIALYNRVGDILTNLEAEFKDEGLTPENLTPEVLEQHLSNDEKALILAFFQYNSALEDAQQDMSAWYKGGKIFAESVPFMLEFLATGGLYKAAGSAATKGMAGALKKWVLGAAKGSVKRTLRKGAAVALRDLVYAGVGTLARTAVSPGTYNRMAEESVKIEDGHLDRTKNVFKSFADSYIENLSEISGGLIGKGLGLLGKGIGKAASMSGIPFSKLGSMLADNKLMQTIAAGWKSVAPKFEALGFHGLFEEIGEEYIGNAIREFTIQPGALAEMHKDDNFGAMLIGFAPMTLFGGAMSAVSIGAKNIEAANLGKKLRETLGQHYLEEQIDHMMNLVSGAENADAVWDAIKPLTVGLNAEETQQLFQYGAFMAQNKAMLFAKKAQDDNLAQAKRAELQQTYNKFWQQNAEGAESVQIATLNDGRTVFVVSEPTADGVVSIIDAASGAKGFTNVSNYKTQEVDGTAAPMTQTWSMDAYLEAEIASERRTSEQTRMQREYNEQVQNLQSQIQEGTKINLGTEGNPIIMLATGKFVKDGVVAVDQTGNTHTIGWNQVADAMKQPIRVKTDQQLIDEEMAAIVARNAERRKRMTDADPAMTDAVNESAVQSAEVVTQEDRHIPMNEDGTVNEAAFWEQDPEGYVQWNDEQNQDGGADSLQQVAITKAVLTSLLAEAQQAQQTSNPAERKAAKQRALEIAEKINRLTAIEAGYAEQRIAPLRERAMKWKSLTNAPVYIVETEEDLASISGQAAESNKGGARVRGFAKDGKAYIYLPGIVEESEIDAVFMHEAVAHTGLKGLLGQQAFDELCDQVWEMMSPEMQTVFINYPGVNGNTRAAADEYIAHLAETMGAGIAEAEEKTIWQSIIDFVRNILRSMGIALDVSESELSDLIHMAYADLAKNMAEAEDIAVQQQEARVAEREAPSAARQEYDTYAEDLTHDEIKAVAANDFNAAQEAYDALAASAPKVEMGESAKDFIARKKAYNEQLAEAKAALDARQALMDEIARIDAANAPVLTDAEVLEQEGLGVDTQNDDVRMSVRYVPTEKQREMIIGSIMNVTGRTREEAERWLASETSLAAMINEDLQYLDYVADPKYKAIKDNSDYPQGTVDFNNICRKRLPFTRMFTRLQRRFPNRVFTAEELADIRTIMSKDDLMVACGLCYVEDRRQMVGEVAQSFIDGLQEQFKTYANNPTKKKNAKKFNELIAGDTYVPQVYDLTTQEGLDKLYNEHRGIWEAFQAFNNARGQQSQNLLQGYAEYKREILSWSDKKVKSVNDNGGLRIFSYSDFEAHHLIDVVQIIIDCAAKGVKIQGYTKVPEFARAVADTGIKLNRSLIPLGDTGLVDGQLAFDPVEGIDINDPNFLESNDNVGNILIGINDEQIRIAMADPRIHYIIPYHARQKENIRQKLNVGAWTNYISTQNERNISDGKRVKDNINIYTDILTGDVTTDRQFVEKYLQLCKEKGRIPKFDQFLERDAEGNYLYTPGYYKFLVDFKLFDENGNILPQQPVVAEFDDAFNMQILENYAKDEREGTGEQMNETYDKIVDALGLDESAAEGEDVRFSTVKEIADKFNAELQQQIDGTLPDGHVYQLGVPGAVLASTGIPNLPITLQASVLNVKANDPLHPFALEEIRDLVPAIQRPWAIFKYGDSGKAQNLIVGIAKEDKQFLVGLSLNPTVKGKTLYINSVRNVFPKDNDEWLNWIQQGKLLRVDEKEKIQAIIDALRINPVDYTHLDLDSIAKVVKEFENPSIDAENEEFRFSVRTDEQREKLFEDAKARFGLTNNFKVAGYMLPDGSLLDFSEANDGGDPNQRTLDHREIEGIIMDEGKEYDSRWMYLADFMNEGAIRLLPEYAGINLMKAPTKEQRSRLFDFIYKYNGEVILEIADERLNNVAYVEYDRRTSPSRIFRDIDGYFNEGIVPQQDVRFSFIGERGAAALDKADEATVRLDNLAVARQMEEAGKEAKEIKMATGWERGADNLWRYEIADYNLFFADDWRQAKTLGGAIEHEELFKAYPELRDVNVELNANANINRGAFNKDSNTIQVLATNEFNLKHSLLHEIQHAIQNQEGFARGSSPLEMAKRDGTDTFMLTSQHLQSMKDASVVADSMSDDITVEELKEWRKTEQDEETRRILTDIYTLMAEGSTIQDIRRMYLVEYNAARRAMREELTRADSPYSKYTRVMGEVEARNVAKRWMYDLERRRNTLASETEDIAREDQIFMEGAYLDAENALRFSVVNENQAIFVSNAARAVDAIKMEKATPAQWLAMIEKSGGLKAGEDKWMGLSDWLKASDRKTLTKAEVLEFIGEHMIRIEEERYDLYAEEKAADVYDEIQRTLQSKFDAYKAEHYAEYDDYESDDALEYAMDKLHEEMEDSFPYTIEREYGSIYLTFPYEEVDDLKEWADKLGIEFDPELKPVNETRAAYTTDGLTNKKEIALVVPTIKPWNEYDDIHFGDAGNGRAVAWIRFGETTDEAGNNILVIDEIQSKRHQEGREQGYDNGSWDAAVNEVAAATSLEKKYIRENPSEVASYILLTIKTEEGKALAQKLLDANQSRTHLIPDAPFEKNWHELAMKRMLRYAAENGYDAVAWTKGDQQAERYNIGKVISGIHKDQPTEKGYQRFEINSYTPSAPRFIFTDNEGKIVDAVDNDGEEIQDYVGKNLSEVFGKDLAIKMLGAEENTRISHDEMRVGGEGMKGFYDRMLPAFMNKYGKKWGIKVEDITLPYVEEAGRVMHSVPVTEEMKASVMEGQVMFSAVQIDPAVREEMDTIKAKAMWDGTFMKAPNGAETKLTEDQWLLVRTNNFKNWFGDWENDPENASKVVDENGEPMVVYHGTNEEFNVFGESASRFGVRGNIFGDGYYFSSSKEVAEEYANRYQATIINGERIPVTTRRVIPAFLNIVDMIDIKSLADWKGEYQRQKVRIWNEKSKTADGLVVRSIKDGSNISADTYLVHNSANIKSATETTGLFSESEDIRYSSRFDVNTNPTEAQKKAGNYKMGHLRLDGYNITIENPKGSVRRGTDSKGNEWENTLNNDYGYIRGTEGVDGDHIDVYLSDNPAEGNVFVIDQVNPETREFDEHKVMYGFNSIDEAREAYLANFSEGWNGLGTITEVTKDEFKKWIDSSHRKTKPFSEYKSVKAEGAQSEGYKEVDIRFSAITEAELEENSTSFSVVTDPALLDQLNNEEYITLYRAMQVVDGKLYPPMAGKVAFKEGEEASWGEPTPEQTWLQSDETPWNAVHARYDEDSKDGKHKKGDLKYDKNGDPVWVFKLDKGNGKTLYAAYNPYIHTSASPLNDQFSEAQSRSNLVVVRVLVPKSELTSGYKAEKAKDSVGMKPWHKGPISGVLAQYEGKGREVMLTRYAKIDGIVDFSEVADETIRLFEGTGLLEHPLPTNVFMPGLREELEKRGVQFVETTNKGEIKEGEHKGKTWASVYGKDGLGKKPTDPNKPKASKKSKKEGVRFSVVPTSTNVDAARALSRLDAIGMDFESQVIAVRDEIEAIKKKVKRLTSMERTPSVIEDLKAIRDRMEILEAQAEMLRQVEEQMLDTKPISPDYDRYLDMKEPQSVDEYIAGMLTMRTSPVTVTTVEGPDGKKKTIRQGGKKIGIMLTPETLERELGYSKSDWEGIKYIVSAKDGMSLDAIAEMISEDSGNNWMFNGMDTMEIKDAIINFLMSVESYSEIRDYIENERRHMAEEEADTISGYKYAQAEQYAQSQGMSIDEYNEWVIQQAREARENWLEGAENPEEFAKFEQSNNSEYEETDKDTATEERGEEDGAREEESKDASRGSDTVGTRDGAASDGAETSEEGPSGESDGDLPGDDRGPGDGGGKSRGTDGSDEAGDSGAAVVSTDVEASDRGVDELVEEGKQKAERAGADFMDAITAINGKLSDLHRAAAAQREYDKATIQIVTSLANELLEKGKLSDLTRGEIKRLIATLKDSVGKKDLTITFDRLMNLLITNQLRLGRERFEEFLKIKASKVDARGVEVKGKLDIPGQRVIGALKEGIGLDVDTLAERISDCEDKLSSGSETVRRNAEIDLVGYKLALNYMVDIKASQIEEKNLRKSLADAKEDYDAGEMTKEAYKEFQKSVYNAIRENRIERVNAYEQILDKLAKIVKRSILGAEWMNDAEKQRVERIHHFANSDMQGMPAAEHERKESLFWNNPVTRFLLKPFATFDQMLRSFAPKSRNGEGYLWNHFMGGWLKATENEYKGIQAAHNILDAKAREVFGSAVKRWSDIFVLERSMPKAEVTFWDDGQFKTYEIPQGNLLYIYMVNKMSDGKMKLRRMGITEEDVDAIVANLSPEFIKIADWLQNDFLPGLREKYNAVHEKLFGAPMAAIDNYFPIKVNANSRTRDIDLGIGEMEGKPSTITGSIIKRTKNALALDILHSDAFDVVLGHIEEMEHWAAFAEWNQDLNSLLSYRKFRNRVQNTSGIYGAGTTAWNSFKATAEIAAGVYKPATRADSVDKTIMNIAKGVTGSKIAFRVYTAFKQLLSWPAFLADANWAILAKNFATPAKAWTWSMENLPLFEKRWKSRQAGDSRLMETDADWKIWKSKVVEIAGRLGMTPNAFIDALTVAIGSRSVYETKVKEYLKDGYTQEEAEEKAKRDATVSFNESQQSNESAFLSQVQLDRTVASVVFTVFRNSSMGYQRQYVDAIRNMVHMLKPNYREQSVEYMRKQMVRDGLSEEQAERAANRIYNRSFTRNALKALTFGFVVQFAWNLGPSLVYMLLGDDDEEKRAAAKDAAVRALVGGPVEGMASGNVISNVLGNIAMGEDLSTVSGVQLPAVSDLENVVTLWENDKVRATNEVFNLLISSGLGFSPQTITDAVVSIIDAAGGDLKVSTEITLALLRILQVPQSQTEKLFMDEIDMKADDAYDMTVEEFAQRYARYRKNRSAGPFVPFYSDEDERKREEQYIKMFTQKADEARRTRGSEVAQKFFEYYDNGYEEVRKTIGEMQREIKDFSINELIDDAEQTEARLQEFMKTEEFEKYAELTPYIKMYEGYKDLLKKIDNPDTRMEYAREMTKAMTEMVKIMEDME